MACWVRELATQGVKPRHRFIATVPAHEADEAERKLIAAYRKMGFKLLNQQAGGVNHGGYSEEYREKLRVARLGKTHSPETRAQISKSLQGRVLSVETRLKMSIAKQKAAKERRA
jgi:hypothetical protein